MKSINYICPLNKMSVTITLKCTCGSIDFVREKEQIKYTHFEGFYNCIECNKEHDYMSSSFKKIIHNKPYFKVQ